MYRDDRTSEQLETHTHLVGVRLNSALNRWGPCESGTSIAAWACTPQQAVEIQECVQWHIENFESWKTVTLVESEKIACGDVYIYPVGGMFPTVGAHPSIVAMRILQIVSDYIDTQGGSQFDAIKVCKATGLDCDKDVLYLVRHAIEIKRGESPKKSPVGEL